MGGYSRTCWPTAAHRWRGVYTEGDGDHCHHKDFNKLNNNPTNIERLPAAEHLALHREWVRWTLHRPEVIERCRELHRTEEFRARMSERMRRAETRPSSRNRPRRAMGVKTGVFAST